MLKCVSNCIFFYLLEYSKCILILYNLHTYVCVIKVNECIHYGKYRNMNDLQQTIYVGITNV